MCVRDVMRIVNRPVSIERLIRVLAKYDWLRALNDGHCTDRCRRSYIKPHKMVTLKVNKNEGKSKRKEKYNCIVTFFIDFLRSVTVLLIYQNV